MINCVEEKQVAYAKQQEIYVFSQAFLLDIICVSALFKYDILRTTFYFVKSSRPIVLEFRISKLFISTMFVCNCKRSFNSKIIG